MKTKKLTSGNPLRLILTLALPLMAGNICQQLYTVVDASVVGRGIGMTALAALGASDWFNWLCLSAVQGFAQGFAIPMTQAFGAEDMPRLRKYLGNSIFLTAVTSVVITVLAQCAVLPVLHLLGTPESIIRLGSLYLRIIFGGLSVTMLYNLLSGIVRALGDSGTPLKAMIIASVTNIVLDLLFVLCFGWGVAGAAVATVLAQVVASCFCLLKLRKLTFLKLSREDLRPERAYCTEMLRIGAPVSLQNIIISVGGMIVQSVVNTMGVVFIAGYTATNKLYGVLEIAAISFGYALSTFAGQNLGAGRIDRVKKGAHTGSILGVVTACAITLIMLIFGRSVLGLFLDVENDSAESMKYALTFLRLMSLWLPVLYVLHAVRSTLQGIGNTVIPMLSGAAEFIMRVSSALILPAIIGYTGVFWAETLAWLGADLVLIPGWFITLRHLSSER